MEEHTVALRIELLPSQEQQIQQEAEREGVSVTEVVRRVIEARFPTVNGAAPHEINNTPLTEEERAEEERLFAQLHANMTETRESRGMRTL